MSSEVPKPTEELLNNFEEEIQEMEDIFNRKVFKRVVREGTGHYTLQKAVVKYHMSAYLEGQEEPFDCSWNREEPNVNKITYDSVIPGLCTALLTMREGELSQFMVRPSMAFGEVGCLPRIPPNATILYIVEVLRVIKEGTVDHFLNLEREEKKKIDPKTVLNLCDGERESGNNFYRSGRYREAVFHYRRAIKALEQLKFKTEEDANTSEELFQKLFLNIGMAYNKSKDYYKSIEYLKKAIYCDPNSVKVLFHLSSAQIATGDYSEAEKNLKTALEVEPKSRDIRRALKRIEDKKDSIEEEILLKKMSSILLK